MPHLVAKKLHAVDDEGAPNDDRQRLAAVGAANPRRPRIAKADRRLFGTGGLNATLDDVERIGEQPAGDAGGATGDKGGGGLGVGTRGQVGATNELVDEKVGPVGDLARHGDGGAAPGGGETVRADGAQQKAKGTRAVKLRVHFGVLERRNGERLHRAREGAGQEDVRQRQIAICRGLRHAPKHLRRVAVEKKHQRVDAGHGVDRRGDAAVQRAESARLRQRAPKAVGGVAKLIRRIELQFGFHRVGRMPGGHGRHAGQRADN
jgi:hypothetical protein